MTRNFVTTFFTFSFLSLVLTACGGGSKPLPEAYTASQKVRFDVEQINEAIDENSLVTKEYRLGIGDKVNILVYLADELSGDYQLTGAGSIQLPLVGSVVLAGLTVNDAQQKVVSALAKNILKDPQVTLSISEYGSKEVSVLGAVGAPKVYIIKRGRDPIEMLNLAGGLSEKAGQDLHITSKVVDSETGEARRAKTVVDIATILQPQSPEDYEMLSRIKKIILDDGDSLYVPSAGKVYIDGAIRSPGSYDVENNTTILSLFALAGGVEWTASPRKVKVLRKLSRTENKEFNLDLNDIKNNKAENFSIQDGDLVLVGRSSFKYGLKAFWEYGLRILFLPF